MFLKQPIEIEADAAGKRGSQWRCPLGAPTAPLELDFRWLTVPVDSAGLNECQVETFDASRSAGASGTPQGQGVARLLFCAGSDDSAKDSLWARFEAFLTHFTLLTVTPLHAGG